MAVKEKDGVRRRRHAREKLKRRVEHEDGRGACKIVIYFTFLSSPARVNKIANVSRP